MGRVDTNTRRVLLWKNTTEGVLKQKCHQVFVQVKPRGLSVLFFDLLPSVASFLWFRPVGLRSKVSVQIRDTGELPKPASSMGPLASVRGARGRPPAGRSSCSREQEGQRRDSRLRFNEEQGLEAFVPAVLPQNAWQSANTLRWRTRALETKPKAS